MKEINKVVIPIAGYGSRMFPATLGVTKAMLPILNKPVIQIILEECVKAGINHVILVISPSQDAVIDYFSLKNQDAIKKFSDKDSVKELKELVSKIKIDYVIQHEQKGLGHAILITKDLVNGEDFGVILGDNPILHKDIYGIGELYQAYKENSAYYIGLKEVDDNDTSKYGIVSFCERENDKQVLLDEMIEKPKNNPPSNLAALGRYILKNSIFSYLEVTMAGVGGEIQLTDALRMAIKQEKVYGYLLDGHILDSGNKVGFFETNLAFAMQDKDIKNKILEMIEKYKEEE